MLIVDDLSIRFRRYGDAWRKQTLQPVRHLTMRIEEGTIMAVIGSSGSGKSLLAHAVLGLLPANARTEGTILFRGSPLDPDRVRSLRGREISLIPQSVAYLNPLATVGRQVRRAARLSGKGRAEADASRDRAFARYRLDDTVKEMFPFQISGGMARRVLTATATAGDADLFIADEPTSGLDRDVATQSLAHLRQLADQGKSVMLITHDLEAALTVADQVAVIYAGTTVEVCPADVFREGSGPLHPYTRALWDALPDRNFKPLPGNQPLEGEAVTGCVFAPRCAMKMDGCLAAEPDLRAVGRGLVRCHRAQG